MMYRVDWLKEAEVALAQACLDSSDRTYLTQIAHRLETYLSAVPLEIGRPLSSSVHRLVRLDSLIHEFNAIEDDKHVFVMDAWLIE